MRPPQQRLPRDCRLVCLRTAAAVSHQLSSQITCIKTISCCIGRQDTEKNGFVTATKLGTTNKFFVAATKHFAAATKRFVDRTKHFVIPI